MRLKIVDVNYGPNKAGIAQKSNFCYHILVKHAIENGERERERGRKGGTCDAWLAEIGGQPGGQRWKLIEKKFEGGQKKRFRRKKFQ